GVKDGETGRIEDPANQRAACGICRAQERGEKCSGTSRNAGAGNAEMERSSVTARNLFSCGRSWTVANKTDRRQTGAEVRVRRQSGSAPCIRQRRNRANAAGQARADGDSKKGYRAVVGD